MRKKIREYGESIKDESEKVLAEEQANSQKKKNGISSWPNNLGLKPYQMIHSVKQLESEDENKDKPIDIEI